jgi:hypothetical protein
MAKKQDKTARPATARRRRATTPAREQQVRAHQEESKQPDRDCPSQEPRAALTEEKLPSSPETTSGGAEVNEETVWHAAVNHCLFHYPTLYTPGVPELSSSAGVKIWVVPIVLRFPLSGTVGTVGHIRIDPCSGEVIDSTPSRQAVAKGRQSYKGRSDASSSAPVSHRATPERRPCSGEAAGSPRIS